MIWDFSYLNLGLTSLFFEYVKTQSGNINLGFLFVVFHWAFKKLHFESFRISQRCFDPVFLPNFLLYVSST